MNHALMIVAVALGVHQDSQAYERAARGVESCDNRSAVGLRDCKAQGAKASCERAVAERRDRCIDAVSEALRTGAWPAPERPPYSPASPRPH